MEESIEVRVRGSKSLRLRFNRETKYSFQKQGEGLMLSIQRRVVATKAWQSGSVRSRYGLAGPWLWHDSGLDRGEEDEPRNQTCYFSVGSRSSTCIKCAE